MKKILCIFLLAFLLTGCTATYDLEISNDTFNETLTLNNMGISSEQLEVFTTNAMPVDFGQTCYLDFDTEAKPNEVKKRKGINYYKISSLEDENGLIATSTMELREYSNSRILNTPFVSNHVNTYDDFISIYGFDGVDIFNQYPKLDSFQVNITTDKKVKEHDADKVDGNKYTWNFTSKDEDKTLYIEMDSTKVMNKKSKEKSKNNINLVSFVIFGVILVAILIFAIYMKIKMIYSNKI